MATDIIPPSEIQDELTRIWDSLEGTNKVRASLFNLIFFTKKNPREEYIRNLAEKVIEKFPSRILFISENDQGNYFNTRVSVLSSKEGETDTACDLIEIEVAGTFKERTPFIILPQILPDLPVYVIWGEDPMARTPLFEELKKLAQRIIFDSESISNLPSFAANLIGLEKDCKVEIADLNWGRLQSWRDILATTFYPQERLAMLKKSKTIYIMYNSKAAPFTCYTHIQSIYFQGWLASQLGWDLKTAQNNKGAWTFEYSREGGTVTITLHPDKRENCNPGSILSIDLETDDQGHFSFGRDLNEPHHVHIRFSTLDRCDIPLRHILPKEELGHSLVKEISHRGTSTHFLNLLKKLQNCKELAISGH